MSYNETDWLDFCGTVEDDQLMHNNMLFDALCNEFIKQYDAPKVCITVSRRFTASCDDEETKDRVSKQMDQFVQFAESKFRAKVPKRRVYICNICGNRGLKTGVPETNQMELYASAAETLEGRHTVRLTITYQVICKHCLLELQMEAMKKQVDNDNADIGSETQNGNQPNKSS